MRRFHLTAAAAATVVVLITTAAAMVTFFVMGGTNIVPARSALSSGPPARDPFELIVAAGFVVGLIGWLFSRMFRRDGVRRLEALDSVWRHRQ
jgi:hypothetical protein